MTVSESKKDRIEFFAKAKSLSASNLLRGIIINSINDEYNIIADKYEEQSKDWKHSFKREAGLKKE